jgi:FtsP/CotA-like multicopper oxidase with cupredoxin domain
MDKPLVLPAPYVWWDTFPIPLAKVVTKDTPGAVEVNGQYVLRGYFKMRTRFVDFTGEFVQHCHILAHEDRGMMQLLEVASNKTKLKHH